MPSKQPPALDLNHEHLEALDNALTACADNYGADTVATLRPILMANYEKGRVHKFTEGNPNKVKSYVLRVADIYQKNHAYLEKVQSDLDAEVWDELFDLISKWSHSYFMRKGFSAHLLNNENDFELGSDIAMAIFKARFPYDTDFNAWLRVIVQNICLKFMHTYLGNKNTYQDIEELDETISTIVGEKNEEEKQIVKDNSTHLMNAVLKLKEPKKTIIKMRYFDDCSLEEIAARLNKSLPAIYSLHFRALNDLRKILSAKGID